MTKYLLDLFKQVNVALNITYPRSFTEYELQWKRENSGLQLRAQKYTGVVKNNLPLNFQSLPF